MRAAAALGFVVAALFAGGIAPAAAQFQLNDGMKQRDQRLLDTAIAQLQPQRPGQPDLYVVGFGGDSAENVFRNEVTYLESLFAQRFGAEGRILTLINHSDSMFKRPRPLASLANLRTALAGVAKAMDRDEDLLLLFMTMHGTPDHALAVQMVPAFEEMIDADELRKALDDAGIRNRVIVLSACYSGGFIPRLRNDDSLILTAARHNRPSFGCGTASEATYFTRAWMIEGLNETTDFVAAFDAAKVRIRAREKAEGFKPSLPQIETGKNILARLGAWQAQLQPGPAVAYPYLPAKHDDADSAAAPAQDANAKNERGGSAPSSKGQGKPSL
jgi:Peptidase C13 family